MPTFGAMMKQSAQMTADVQAAYPQDPQDPQYPQGPVVPGGRRRLAGAVRPTPGPRVQRPDRPTARMTG